jgi:hypothetical protein
MRGFSVVLLSALCLLFASTAMAQDDPPTVEELLASLTDKQKLEWADVTVTLLDGSKIAVLDMIEDAQKNNDIILLNCLNEKLGMLKPLSIAAVDARDGLAEAVARENADLVEHNFRKSYISREQGEIFAAEAEACIGQVGTSFPGQTRVIPKYDGPGEADTDFGAASGGNTRPPDASALD